MDWGTTMHADGLPTIFQECLHVHHPHHQHEKHREYLFVKNFFEL